MRRWVRLLVPLHNRLGARRILRMSSNPASLARRINPGNAQAAGPSPIAPEGLRGPRRAAGPSALIDPGGALDAGDRPSSASPR